MGTILHEMGHYTQFWIHRGYNHYNDIPKLLKEVGHRMQVGIWVNCIIPFNDCYLYPLRMI